MRWVAVTALYPIKGVHKGTVHMDTGMEPKGVYVAPNGVRIRTSLDVFAAFFCSMCCANSVWVLGKGRIAAGTGSLRIQSCEKHILCHCWWREVPPGGKPHCSLVPRSSAD